MPSRFQLISRYVGYVLLVNAFLTAICFFYSLIIGDDGRVALGWSTLIITLCALLPLLLTHASPRITNWDGYTIVVFAWLAVCLFGMLPYLLYGPPFGLADAWFEAVSGYTTTGATVVANVEALPKSLLLFRAFTHWFGGIGVVLFVLVVLPGDRKGQNDPLPLRALPDSPSGFQV